MPDKCSPSLYRDLPLGMQIPVCTLIWASPRLDMPELHWLRCAMAQWYGSGLNDRALFNVDNCVDPTVMQCLDMNEPPPDRVFYLLKTIAKRSGIEFDASLTDADSGGIEDAKGDVKAEHRETEHHGSDTDTLCEEEQDWGQVFGSDRTGVLPCLTIVDNPLDSLSGDAEDAEGAKEAD